MQQQISCFISLFQNPSYILVVKLIIEILQPGYFFNVS